MTAVVPLSYKKFYPAASISENGSSRNKPFYYYIKMGAMDLDMKFLAVIVTFHLLTMLCYCEAIFNATTTRLYTVIFAVVLIFVTSPGVSVGAHRLWTHRAFKAKLPVRIFLAIGHTLSGQFSIYTWCRFHRTHHKFSDTDGDPHSTKRGMLFAHLEWVVRHRHPEAKEKMHTIDYSDLLADPVVQLQHRYFGLCYLVVSYAIPIAIPVHFWNESFYFAFLAAYVARQVLSIHIAAFVNSAAHLFGDKPYNHAIEPRNSNFVACLTYGEGYHNYHHAYPYDYQLSEMGMGFNLGRLLIETWAKYGLAYDLKRATDTSVDAAKKRTADRREQPNVDYY